MIKLENVFLKNTKDFYTIYDLSLTLDKSTLFIGDEVVGSTALMRILSKIEKEYTGTITFDDVDIKNIKDKDLPIIYIPKENYLFNNNVYKNLLFPLKIRKINKKIAENTINNTIIEYNLENFINYLFNKQINKLKNKNKLIKKNYAIIDKLKLIKIKNLTSAEKKIITLIRALTRDTKYILLEHLFDSLSEDTKNLAITIIEKLKNKTIIIACEETDKKISCYQDFNKFELEKNKD